MSTVKLAEAIKTLTHDGMMFVAKSIYEAAGLSGFIALGTDERSSDAETAAAISKFADQGLAEGET
ncbi:MAG: hypothetical protein AAGA70_12425 [Pseudomonadota bacterium]